MHGPKWPFLLAHGPGMVVVDCWDRFCTLGRAPRTKETLPDFHEWCRVTRHPRVFRRLTVVNGPPEIGASHLLLGLSDQNLDYVFFVIFYYQKVFFILYPS